VTGGQASRPAGAAPPRSRRPAAEPAARLFRAVGMTGVIAMYATCQDAVRWTQAAKEDQ
jgi:hypothetical protein